MFLTPWPAVLFAAVLAFVVAMALSGVIARAGSGAFVRLLAVLLAMGGAAAAAWAFGYTLAIVNPALFQPAFALDRAATTVPFALLGALAGIGYAEGYRLSALWR